MTIVFELITIISLLALTVIFYLSGETKRGPFDTQAETMWTMRARRVGPARCAPSSQEEVVKKSD